MAIHRLFAENLRVQCMRHASIAEVCRGIGINRQQFNKYLGGQSLPNARTLVRICSYLRIDESELFTAPTREAAKPARNHELSHFISTPGLREQPDIGIGLYNCYFPMQGFGGFVVRSVLSISQKSGHFTFVRHTRISSPSTSKAVLAFGKHHGVLLSNGSTNYLLGLNSAPPLNASFMAMPREATGGTNLRFGLAVVHGISQPFACQVCLQHLGRGWRPARTALERVGILALTDPTVPVAVATFLRSRTNQESSQLIMPSFEGLLVEPGP